MPAPTIQRRVRQIIPFLNPSIFRIRIENVHLDQGHILNPHGKTKNSRRYLPISDRMVELIQRRWGDRTEGWLFPSDSECGH
jgi:integrase